MANWSLDGIIELIQKYYHHMKFKTEDGWARHTPHVMLTSKAKRFAQDEYCKTTNCRLHDDHFVDLNDASASHDPNNNRSNTAIKCRQLEKLCIANYCNILGLCKEIPGRKYDKNEFIKALSKVEVILKDEDKDAKAKQRVEQACTEEEGAMADLIDELFENANRSTEES